MTNYVVYVDWEGYSRGVAAYEIEAENEEEARELYLEGKLLHSDVVRDDTESQVYKIKEII
ncbi:MAG: hypothetical protein CMF22_10495 [Idiomarinaceae bacterium]|nr:hypothetical protein [Idiomarinaceae bacterium]MBG23869.1 hypothetical protein [Idiomarinaceae bacterium]|tara:strand:- start:8589 stop:8771 length:183 start_codon:yes stop_codon:yes gene_type:complete